MNNEEKLKILIEAHNKANKAFEDVNKQIGKTEKRFEGMGAKLDKVAGKMKSVGSKMSTRVTLPIIAGAGLAVKAFSDLNETMNKVDVSFGDSADEVKKWSEGSIESMGLAQQTALDSAALFGDMGTGMGQTTKEASKMSMNLTQLAADMASFKNVSADRAQTALAGIYTGETEALKSMGIVMTQTNLEQFAMEKGIKKNISEMTQQEKIQLRYNYVMEKTANAQGDFARTSDGIANQTRMAGERTKQLAADFGEKLAPAMNKLLEVGGKILDWFDGLSDGQMKLILILGGIVAALGPVIMIIGHLITAIRGIGMAFSFLAANPMILAVIAIILVVAGLAYIIYKNWGSIKKFFIDLWKKVTDATKSFTDWISGIWESVVGALTTAWEAVSGFFVDLWNGVKGVFNAVIGFFKKWGVTILAVIFWPFSLAIGLIIANWETIKGFFQGIWNFIKAVFTPVVQFFVSYFTNAWNGIVRIWNMAVGFFSAIWRGIVAIFSRVIGFYVGVFTAAWNGIKAVWSAVTGYFSRVWAGIVRIFSPIVGFFSNAFRRAWGAIRSAFGGVVGFFRGIWNNIVSMFRRVGTSVGDAISGAFRSAVRGVLSGGVSLINKFIGMINGATGTINKIPGVNIGKIGELSVPSFYTGVRNFGGGLATVGDINGRGGEIVSMPRGSDVFSNRESKNILRSLADGNMGGGKQVTVNVYPQTAEASREIFRMIDNDTLLNRQGFTPVRGGAS